MNYFLIRSSITFTRKTDLQDQYEIRVPVKDQGIDMCKEWYNSSQA